MIISYGVTDIISAITVSSQQQSQGRERVNQAIVAMEHAIQENASQVQDAALPARCS